MEGLYRATPAKPVGGLYLLKRFAAALSKVCTVKPAQLHLLIRFKSVQVMASPAGVKSHHSWEKHFVYFTRPVFNYQD